MTPVCVQFTKLTSTNTLVMPQCVFYSSGEFGLVWFLLLVWFGFAFDFVFVCFCFVFLMNTGLILFFCLWTSNSPEPLHTQFFEDAVISLLNNFGHYSQISDGCCYVYLCLCLLVYMSVFMPVSNGLLYRYLQVWTSKPSRIVLFAQDCFGNPRSFVFPFEIWLVFFLFLCKMRWDFHWNHIQSPNGFL